MYACVTNGCPDYGSLEMVCKQGFKADSPFCAVCEFGYWKTLSVTA
jgi:hypothetical protein